MFSILLYTLIGSIVVNLFYWLFVFTKIKKRSPNNSNNFSSVPITIIISAKNEAHNLEVLIPLLLNQNYPEFEILIINDCSTDKTSEVINSFVQSHQISTLEIHNNQPGKKFAIQKAIDKAKYEMLLFTDADCRPKSNLWIDSMMKSRTQKPLILGYGPMFRSSGWLNKYIRYETFLTAIQYFSYAVLNRTYMGVGRNMAYTKSLFNANNGFQTHNHIPSGDDDLFINSLKYPEDASICIDRDSFMYSEAKKSFASYYQQKTRHYSTSMHYKWIDKISLGLFALSHMLIYFSFFILLLSPIWKIAIIVYIIRIGLILLSTRSIWKTLDVHDIIWYFPLLDFLNFLFYILFTPATLWPKRNHW